MSEALGIESSGRGIEPRNGDYCGYVLMKADQVDVLGRQQPRMRNGEYMWYHRGLRTEHELKGATQEPGRAKYFLVEKRR